MTTRGLAKMAISQPENQTGAVGLALKAAAGAYLIRHGREEETHERIRRPYGSAPRRSEGWR